MFPIWTGARSRMVTLKLIKTKPLTWMLLPCRQRESPVGAGGANCKQEPGEIARVSCRCTWEVDGIEGWEFITRIESSQTGWDSTAEGAGRTGFKQVRLGRAVTARRAPRERPDW